MKETAVLVIYSDTDFGGAERRLIRIYNEIAKKRKCEIIVRGSDKEEFYKRLVKADCKIDNIQKVLFFRSNILCILYLLFSEKYSSVHYFDLCGFNQGIATSMRLKRIKTVLTIAYQNYAYGIVDSDTRNALIRLINSTEIIDVLFPEGGKYLPTISSNPNINVTPGTFTNTDLFVPGKKEKILLFAAARLEKDKNAELLVNAVCICSDDLRQRGYKVIICGKDFEEENLRNQIYTLKLQDIIDMPGYVRVSEVFPKTEVFLCLDLVDNYPAQTIAEAVSCGCGLICTDVGYSRMCGSEDFAMYVPNNPEDLARAIVQFISLSENEKNKVEKNARHYALEHYSISESREYFERLLW